MVAPAIASGASVPSPRRTPASTRPTAAPPSGPPNDASANDNALSPQNATGGSAAPHDCSSAAAAAWASAQTPSPASASAPPASPPPPPTHGLPDTSGPAATT